MLGHLIVDLTTILLAFKATYWEFVLYSAILGTNYQTLFPWVVVQSGPYAFPRASTQSKGSTFC